MSRLNLIKLISSNGKVNSVANENIVIKDNDSQTAFAWKQLSLKVFAECNIIINGNSNQPSYLNLPSGMELQIDNLYISSLTFKESGIPYFYYAGI